MSNKAVVENDETLEFPAGTKNKECVIKLLTIMFLHLNLFLVTINLTKCVTKLSILIFLQYNLFLFFIFSSLPDQSQTQGMCKRDVYADHFMLKYCPERYKAQKIC